MDCSIGCGAGSQETNPETEWRMQNIYERVTLRSMSSEKTGKAELGRRKLSYSAARAVNM